MVNEEHYVYSCEDNLCISVPKVKRVTLEKGYNVLK